jgi:hypothetical protein
MVSRRRPILFEKPALLRIPSSRSPLGKSPHKARVEGVSLMTALVAALHMATESGRPAHFDGGHDAPLPCGHRRAMLFAVGFAIAAEHVRHFQLRTIHAPRR